MQLVQRHILTRAHVEDARSSRVILRYRFTNRCQFVIVDLKSLGTFIIPFDGGEIGKPINIEWAQEEVDIGCHEVLYTRSGRPGARRYHRCIVPRATFCATQYLLCGASE